MTTDLTPVIARVPRGQRQNCAPAISDRPFRPGKVLLLDGYSTRTLACVRSWGRKNIPFAVGGETRWDMSLFSRYAKEKFVYSSPKRDLKKFIQDVNRYCREFHADSVFPTSEAAIMACSEHREELVCPAIVPGEREIRMTFSKANTLAVAESVGISIPKTVTISNGNVETLATVEMKFPVVLKSSCSEVLLANRIGTSGKTFYAYNRGEMEAECLSRLAKGQTVLLQEFIDGYGVGVSGLFSAGTPVALIGHRRLRESNPCGGPSALAEAVAIDPQLARLTTALFQALAFTGPAMAEYKIDRRDGRAYLMEINGRLWGTILLAPAAGLDLPFLYWKMLNGMEITPEETKYKVGVKGRNLTGDAKCLALCLKGRPSHWKGDFPSRWEAVKAFTASFLDKQTKDLILTSDDPMPLLGTVIRSLP